MKKYFYINGDARFGPFSFEDLKLESLSKDTLIWREGLVDWTPAYQLQEMIPILELLPPPLDSDNPIALRKYDLPRELKEGSSGWMIAGYIFALLGGILGIIIGANYAFGKYNSNTKTNGWIMMILGFVFAVLWRAARHM